MENKSELLIADVSKFCLIEIAHIFAVEDVLSAGGL